MNPDEVTAVAMTAADARKLGNVIDAYNAIMGPAILEQVSGPLVFERYEEEKRRAR